MALGVLVNPYQILIAAIYRRNSTAWFWAALVPEAQCQMGQNHQHYLALAICCTGIKSFISLHSIYTGSSALPGIGDLLHQYQTLNATAKEERFAQIRKHISDIMITFHQEKI